MRTLLALVASFSIACTSASPVGADGGGDTLTAEERAGFDVGAPGANALVQLTGLVDRLFQFDPTLDPGKAAGENAQAIRAEIAKNLGDAGDGGVKCGSVSVSSNSVTVDFGPPPGCSFKGATVSGSIKLDVSGGGGGSVKVAVTFTSVVYDGQTIDGTASFTTANGTSFTVDANVTIGKTTYTATGFTITGSPGSVKLDGAISTGETSITFMGVVWKSGDCYPSAGSIVVKKGVLVQTITMTSATATTGQVTVTVGKKTSTSCLPSYASCSSSCGK